MYWCDIESLAAEFEESRTFHRRKTEMRTDVPTNARAEVEPMTTDIAEITVIGGDDTGLVARVTSLLFERGLNIEDLDQAVRDGVFRMYIAIDTSEMVCTEAKLRADLHTLGDDLGLDVQVRFPSDRETQQIAVLVTKESHCLEALFEAWANDDLGADIGVVVGNHDDLEPLADHYDVPFHDIGDEGGQQNEDRLLEVLSEYDVDLIVLARYMRILSPNVVFRYEDRIINVHPSLLPAFPGAEAYRQAVEEGVRIAGVTAHYVTTDLDQGPIITQRAFDVPDDADVETMKRRGQPLEADALLEAVRLHLRGDVSVHRGRTTIRENSDEYLLGLPEEVAEITPDRPIDGIGRAITDDN
ncbi:Formyltetrahydrofolate deformylase [Natrarchaeobaculum sulfurireducens]|uniref:Formyltetrahydrofolate deformylase n=2 Tax=Natrarchaeobaculum sulfurireducens TaxID=2044521 RepID=A0A346PJB2_9EURY|nr:Formyltetrahydrofolate hydrolase [Natrarchaeobaculum sulfurireducens]AXR83380.1 Formyltetrahydrofolate deformylase [Natrarchaeobaculum sulfurireducens]